MKIPLETLSLDVVGWEELPGVRLRVDQARLDDVVWLHPKVAQSLSGELMTTNTKPSGFKELAATYELPDKDGPRPVACSYPSDIGPKPEGVPGSMAIKPQASQPLLLSALLSEHGEGLTPLVDTSQTDTLKEHVGPWGSIVPRTSAVLPLGESYGGVRKECGAYRPNVVI